MTADTPDGMPQWICKRCGRPLDDHQLRGLDTRWLPVPMCVDLGIIAKGIRLPS